MELRKMFFLSLVAFFAAGVAHYVQALEGEAIIGGEQALLGQFPYQVALVLKFPSETEFFPTCGGTIISSNYVVTAAHCVIDTDTMAWQDKPLSVIIKSIDLAQSIVGKSKTELDDIVYDVVKAWVPLLFSTSQRADQVLVHDIAVLRLRRNLNLEDPLLWALNPAPKDSDSFDGKAVIASGYGVNSINITIGPNGEITQQGKTSNKLRFVEAEIVNLFECQKYYKKKLSLESHICARTKQHIDRFPDGEGVCRGDSGGPLIYNNMLIGVSSSGPVACIEAQQPAVYTRVSSMSSFLEFANDFTLPFPGTVSRKLPVYLSDDEY